MIAEIPQDQKFEKLDVGIRNMFQIHIMEKLLGKEIDDVHKQIRLIDEYGKLMSDIIDDPKNVEIIDLVREGEESKEKYEKAIDMVIEKIHDKIPVAA